MAADVPKIVLTPQDRSHYFNRRECVVNEPLKVGRSVDRRRISPNNLIFDCRVLSRNHALIWFENGKFFIKDTKSSNGTFVNENRLSPSGEESGPVELKSRDVVQFGVNVNVDKKVTHGCIIATVKLYINDVEVAGHEPPVQQVMQILMSALGREQELETKLASMQSVLNLAKELATDSMIAIVKEDELMSRLEMLENQLQVYSRNATDDELKKQLSKAFEDKHKNELASKDSLRGILQEKLECISKLNQLQRDYDKAEQECQKYRTLLEEAKEEHSQEVSKLREQLQNSERDRKEIESKLTEERTNLTSSLESLQAEAEFTKTQLEKTKTRLSETEEELVELKIAMETQRQRRAKETTEGSIIPPGTEDPQGSLVPPGTEDPTGEEFPKPGQKVEEVSDVVTASLEETIPQIGRSSSPFDRRETILAPQWASMPEAVLKEDSELKAQLIYLETELRVSQGRVKQLEEQLGMASSNSDLPPDAAPFKEDMLVTAKRLSDTAITKGQVEVLKQSLLEAEKVIEKLKAKQAPHAADVAPDSRGIQDTSQDGSEELSSPKDATINQLKSEVHMLGKNVTQLESQLTSVEEERRSSQEEKKGMEIELSVVTARFTSMLQDNTRIKSEYDELRIQNEDLHRKVDELYANMSTQEPVPGPDPRKVGPPTPNRDADRALEALEEERQHVRLLTIIALVSIGVAFASWLMG